MVLLKVRIFTLGLLIGFSLLMPEASARPANPSIQTAQARQSAVDRVEQFQWQLIASPVMGLPTAEQLEALSPYLSNQLLTRIRAASLAQKAITQRSQIPEPPLIQGALFYSLFEGASGVVHRYWSLWNTWLSPLTPVLFVGLIASCSSQKTSNPLLMIFNTWGSGTSVAKAVCLSSLMR
jgi:hypothetical protein